MAKNGTLAETLLPDDLIIVTLAAVEGGPSGNRIAISAQFNGAGAEVDATRVPIQGGYQLQGLSTGGQAQPKFPEQEFMESIKKNGGVPSGESMQIQKDYEAALAAWEGSGNKSLPEAIAAAVLQFAEARAGVKTVDGPHPFINPDQVTVRPAYRESATTPVVFSVTLAPVWG